MELKINHVIGLRGSVIVTGEWLEEAAVIADMIPGVSVIASHVGVELIGPLMMEDVIRLMSINHINALQCVCVL